MRRTSRYGLVFTTPAIAFFLLFWILPFVLAIVYSFTDWKVGRTANFVGLTNYIDLATDPRFHQSLQASALITFLALVVTVLVALGLAVLLDDDGLRGRRLFEAIIILPVITDWVATGLVWQLMFLPYQGVLAGLFSTLGLRNLANLAWTGNKQLAPLAIVIFIVWKTTGLYTIIFLAALKSVPRHYAEAAVVDGANSRQVFVRITLPLIRPVTVFVIVLAFVSTIGLFEPIFMLTGGGPADATRVLPIFLYENFFQFRNAGYASAAGIFFLLICLAFAIFTARRLQYSYYE
jgi:ABC-type sugar transport system permease subunit